MDVGCQRCLQRAGLRGAVCLSMWVSIDASLAVALLCYAALTVPALLLLRTGTPPLAVEPLANAQTPTE